MDNLSYLVPRDPSIKSWSDRVKINSSNNTNVFKLDLDDVDEYHNEKLKVYLRLKPYHMKSNTYSINNCTLEATPPEDSITYKNLTNKVGTLVHKFQFTSILNQDASQEEVFEKCIIDSLIRFISGENDLLFAYGTTNAGKTFTMQGKIDKPGVIPRAMQFIFNSLKDNMELSCQYQPRQYNDIFHLDDDTFMKERTHKNFILNLDLGKYERQPEKSYRNYKAEITTCSSECSNNYENATFREIESNCTALSYKVSNDRYALWVSMIEIYNEQIYDLLEIPDEKGSRQKLRFGEDESGKVYVKNLRYINVTSGHEAFQIFQFGRANLHLAPTALNNKSSRSHCIFTITLARFLDIGNSSHALLSRFSFCDLAGIERVKKTLNIGCRLAESKSINTSLSVFTKCINVLKDNQCNGERKPVPYRESKLTRLFKYAMMGKERLSLIINVTPEPVLFDETIKVLKFSAMAQQIVPMGGRRKNKLLRSLKKTRFSSMVSKADDTSKIIWEASTVIDTKASDDQAAYFEDLLCLVDRLKKDLAEERKRSQTIEKEIREELTAKFSEIIRQHNELSTNHLKNETHRMQDMYERRQKRLIEFYEKEQDNVYKRRKVEKNYMELESKLKETENDLELLTAENDSLREMIHKLSTENNKLQSRYTRLEFDFSDKVKLARLYEKSKETDGTEINSYVKELETQLSESNLKIKELKELLDESAVDYKDLMENHKCLKEENENLLNELATATTAVEDLKNELLDHEKMLSEKTEIIEQLEKLKTVDERNQELIENYERDKLECMKKVEESEIKIRELTARVRDTKLENERLASEKLNYEESVNGLREKTLALETELENLRGKLDVGESVPTNNCCLFGEESEEVRTCSTECENLKEEKEMLALKYEQQAEQIKLLEGDIKKLNAEIIELNNERETFVLREEPKSETSRTLKSTANNKSEVNESHSETSVAENEKSASHEGQQMPQGGGDDESVAESIGRQIENLSLFNSSSKKSSKKEYENVHPSLLKSAGRSTRKGRKQKKNEDVNSEEVEEPPVIIKEKEKYHRKLFLDNDFDNMGDLESSFIEPEIPRLRPRKK